MSRSFCGYYCTLSIVVAQQKMVLATERPVRAPAPQQQERPLAEMPIGCMVHVPRKKDDGSLFHTWCKVVQHIPSSYGSSVKVEVEGEAQQTITLRTLNRERAGDFDWVKNLPVPAPRPPKQKARQHAPLAKPRLCSAANL